MVGYAYAEAGPTMARNDVGGGAGQTVLQSSTLANSPTRCLRDVRFLSAIACIRRG